MPPPLSPADVAADLVRRYAVAPADLVVEVGSGVGTLLRAVRERGPRVLGVDPDARTVVQAYQAGVDTIAAHFGVGTADYIRRRYGPARVLLAHASPTAGAPPEVLAAAPVCLAPDGVVVLLHDAIFAEVRPAPPLPRAA